ncbi:TIR domain-containing protein [Myxococcota bacterium]|nr:TIR domain-containing protein [Myxococcota bacterium]
MSLRHRVFVSYHHALDQQWKDLFYQLFHVSTEALVDGSVWDGDIDPNVSTDTARRIIRDRYLRDTTVTVVLVGAQTWQRKHVDWEISASVRDTEASPRSGLLGILLPSYPMLWGTTYDAHTIPPRLFDNVQCGYASLHRWSNDPVAVQTWIHDAFLRRRTHLPDNSRVQFARNHFGNAWSD